MTARLHDYTTARPFIFRIVMNSDNQLFTKKNRDRNYPGSYKNVASSLFFTNFLRD
jgi:hypothetical protein